MVSPVATPFVGVGSHRRTGEHGEKALMTLWRNLVVALVAAFALAACSSSSDPEPMAMPEPEPTPEERCTAAGDVWSGGSCISAADDAYNTARAAIAAAETAEAAEAAVATAVEAGITGAQLQSLNMAVEDRKEALQMAADAAQRQALEDAAMCTATTAECVAAHNALIAALQGDVNRLADDENATNAQQDAAQAALDAAIAARDAVQMAINEIDRTTTAGREVREAIDAAAALETDRSVEAIEAAKVAIEEARQAVGDDDSYDARIAMAERYVARAEERNVVAAAVMEAEAAATGLASDSSVDAVTAAQVLVDAANMAITDAEHLTDAEKATETAKVVAAQGTVTVAKNKNDAAAKIAKDEADQKAKDDAKEKAKEMAAAGKALKKALGAMPLAWLGGDLDNVAAGDQSTNLSSSGLQVNVSDRADTPAFTASPRMKAGASAGSLGAWAGKHYSHTNAGTKVSNSAVVYTNQAAPTVKPFAEGASFGADQAAFDSAYTAATRTLNLGDNLEGGTNIKGGDFPTAGGKTFIPTAPSLENTIRGTYQGAPGSYRCTSTSATATNCGATATAGGGVTLVGTWVFTHDSGAMTSRADANYLYFGWWLQKDKDDEPTSASAFTGVVGDVDGNETLTDPLGLTGSATYNGAAAGKFAINDPLTGGDAGHFTADATLTAKFGVAATAGNGISGTLDNFMANDQAVPWSVSLLHLDLTATGGTIAVDDTDTADVNESINRTTWSIDGNSAAASGSWSAQLYDEKPGNAPTGDGSNVATSVTGTFQSHFGSTHTMVGAFGATKE